MRSSSSIRPLTVREIAKRIRRDDEDLDVVVNRLRNWTKEGLLELAGDKHPGIGRSRHYPDHAVIDALVLSALTAIGIPAVRAASSSGAYSTVLELARQAHQEFSKRESRGKHIFLVVYGAEGGVYDGLNPSAALTYARHGEIKTRVHDDQGDTHLFVNLNRLFQRLEKNSQE
jgi:hypothetical protein